MSCVGSDRQTYALRFYFLLPANRENCRLLGLVQELGPLIICGLGGQLAINRKHVTSSRYDTQTSGVPTMIPNANWSYL
jgi:hypothetical protein